MAAAPNPWPTLYLTPGDDDAMAKVPLGTADDRTVEVPRTFGAVYALPGVGKVTLRLAAEAGRVRVTEVHLEETSDSGVTSVRFGKVNIGTLLERAVAQMAFLSGTQGLTGSREVARQATRKRVSDDRLERIADAWARGGIAEVMATEHVSERHAYRLKARAVDAGLITEEVQS